MMLLEILQLSTFFCFSFVFLFHKNSVFIPGPVGNLQHQKILKAAAGLAHSLALDQKGHIFSWGCNSSGQLGAVFGWGRNDNGQLGLGDRSHRVTPYLLSSLEDQKIVYMCCGRDHSVALNTDGHVFTFGAGKYGQLGHGSTDDELIPRKIQELSQLIVTQIAAGKCHSLAFAPKSGNIYSFGLNESGQLANLSSGLPQAINEHFFGYEKEILRGSPSWSPYAIDRIFAGGDQSFATVKHLQPLFLPADYRERKINDSILEVNTSSLTKILPGISEESEVQEALTFVESVFQSSSCLNGSFLKYKSHYGCSSSNHGIRIEEVESTFNKLSLVQNDSILNRVLKCVTQYMIPNFNLPSPHPENLRICIILPFYHEMMITEHFAELQIPFARLLLRVIHDENNEAVIGNWYEDLPAECFLRVIGIYKKIIVYLLNQPGLQLTAPCYNVNLFLSLEVLKKFHAISQKRLKTIGFENFYVPELTRKVDIRKDFYGFLRVRLNPSLSFFFCNYPFLFDAIAKTVLLRTHHYLQRKSRDNIESVPREIDYQSEFLNITVSRKNILDDTINQLGSATVRDFKKELKVKFVGEEAQDYGGVRKEFLILITREILDPEQKMFKVNEETRSLWFSPSSETPNSRYSVAGLLCGLAIYNSTIINLPFPPVLYKKLLKEPVGLADVADVSPQFHRSCISILEYEGDDFEETFSLTFEVQHQVSGKVVTVPLKPGFEDTPVSQSNKHEYVDLYVDFLLNKSIEKQYDYFHQAFHNICGGNALNLFHSSELLVLVSGSENYDWHEFEKCAGYRNGYSVDHPTIKLFWEVFHDLQLEEKKNFLKFLTGSDRVPISGMKSLKIHIQPMGGGDAFLPVAHTCFGLLDLPQYHTKENLRYKLLQSIQHTEGFSLV
ncbi:hypothetical protein QYM36_018695 [Artemia franciscana]|uniref:HECT domain-containing protein n=1 Tax=Artemia franciscana TaxID=6661 RepID=A0AA88KUI5_ARTSF|nr:hypothetical protein QYM36_018695 [Artemia franciscana]